MKKYWITRLTARRCNGQSASYSAQQNTIMRKTGFISPSTKSLSDQLLLAWDSKHEIISTSPLASWMVFRITVYTSSINAQTFCGRLFPVNIWSTPPNTHDRISTRPLSAISDLTQPMKLMRKCIPPKCCTIIVESIRLNPGYVDSNPYVAAGQA